MKPVYEREKLIIIEFSTDDVIATSAAVPEPEPLITQVTENVYRSFGSFKMPGNWF